MKTSARRKSEIRQDASELRQNASELRQDKSEKRCGNSKQFIVCLDHSGVVQGIKDMLENQKRIEADIKNIYTCIKTVPRLLEKGETNRKLIYGCYSAWVLVFLWILAHLASTK